MDQYTILLANSTKQNSILTFQFQAHGKPDATTTDQSSAGNYSSVPFDFESPYIENNEYKEQIESFMAAMSDALDKYLNAMISQTDKEKQEFLRSMAMDGCYSYVNSVVSSSSNLYCKRNFRYICDSVKKRKRDIFISI